jgi:hypothetical protein
VNGRCVPLDGYYETGVTVAAGCPYGCSLCSSATSCSECYSKKDFKLKDGVCYAKKECTVDCA